MPDQYSPPRMAALFSDASRLDRWLEVELAALEAHERLGHGEPGMTAAARAAIPRIDETFVTELRQRRTVTQHEVAAFVDVLCARVGHAASAWVHVGLTSSDIIDTANGLLLAGACDLLLESLQELRRTLAERAAEFAATPIMGRTHGMHAEPTTFGAKVALWESRVGRDMRRLAAARECVAVGSLSGPVGNYANVDPGVEELVCAALHLQQAVNGQFVSRDRYAEYVWACACVGCTVEMICTQVRLLHTSEVGEVGEVFSAGQKGSSSMPHKKNPVVSMELSGLARLLRSYLIASMESTGTWHEGDTTALALERILLPDVSNLTLYCIERLTALVRDLQVNAEAMQAKFTMARGIPFSGSVLQALVDAGVDRDSAYRAVQSAATVAALQGSSLGEVLRQTEPAPLSEEELGEALSLERALRNVPIVLRELDAGQ